jgi:hypothetical protein
MSSPAQPLEMGFAKIASVLAGVWPNFMTIALVVGVSVHMETSEMTFTSG